MSPNIIGPLPKDYINPSEKLKKQLGVWMIPKRHWSLLPTQLSNKGILTWLGKKKCCEGKHHFSTHEPFLIETFQSHDETKDTHTFKIFQFSIGNSKCMVIIKFCNDAPMLNYCQKFLNSCCFSSLASYLTTIEQTNAVNAISLRIEESLKSKIGNHIDFANANLKN